ncbi:MAG: MFS transporter [Thermoflavifilum sp.]|nr:MFS transporter [Thermoflavifilum sp.]MCL6515247.1 MFS transporter [Alicyclobacillus sp.]
MASTQVESASAPAAVHVHEKVNIWRQPKAVWAVAFACVVAFMGLGLVDPILPAIRDKLHATPSQVELLFTSYQLVTGVAMLVTGVVSTRIGPKRTLLTGLALIVLFSAAAGSSGGIWGIVGFRAGWGLGNALFIATALAVIVSVARGGTEGAVILYEAALGLGISVGPLLGGALGGISWRGPFYGVAVLMAIGFLLIALLLPRVETEAKRTSLADPIRALRHGGLLTMALCALLYNYGFFTLLGFTPFILNMGPHGLGLVFFGWGVLLAITSVLVAPRIQAVLGTLPTMVLMLLLIAADLAVIATHTHDQTVVIACVIIAGAFLGINNTLITTAVMEVSPVPRPVASSAYSFVRFVGGALAPWLAGKLGESIGVAVPFYVGTVCVVLSVVALLVGRKALRGI